MSQTDYKAPADWTEWTYLDLAMAPLTPEAEAFFLAQNDPQIRQGLAENQTLSRDALRVLSEDEDDEVRAIVAENPDLYAVLTPDEVIAFIDGNAEVLAGVALICNDQAIIDRLTEEFLTAEDPELRGALATCVGLSKETMDVLVQDEAYEVRAGLLSNEVFHDVYGEDFVRDFVGDDPDMQDVYDEYCQLTAMCEEYGDLASR